MSAYIAKPTAPQNGNNLVWNGTNWIAQAPPPYTINNHLLDTASVGSIIWHAAPTPPVGYLECNGASVSRSQYPELFEVIGTQWGAVDDNSFNLPDLRSEFVRGWDHGRGIDVGRPFGTYQVDSLSAHFHPVITTVDTNVVTLVNTDVQTNVDLDFDINVDTFVNTTVNTELSTTIDGEVTTSVIPTLSVIATTTVNSLSLIHI